MKTSSRVKRTVREMPRRLTIKLSKGSNRNMVEDAGQAGFHTQTRLQMIPSDSTSLGKEASPLQVTNSISKFTSSHCLNTELWRRTVVQKGHRSTSEFQVSLVQIELWWTRQDTASGIAFESGLFLGKWAARVSFLFGYVGCFQGFTFFPAPKHSAGEFVLKGCIARSTEKSSPWCQKNPDNSSRQEQLLALHTKGFWMSVCRN